MRILEQKAELLPELDNLYFQIAKRGKICYRREDTATEEGAKAFTLDKLKKRHTTCLEQAQLYIFVPCEMEKRTQWLRYRYNDLKYVRVDEVVWKGVYGFFISGSLWALREAFPQRYLEYEVDYAVTGTLNRLYPDIFPYIGLPSEIPSGFTRPTVLSEADIQAAFKALPEWTENHIRRAIRFRTNRAIGTQVLRHRPFSFLQESQRYCRYDKGVEVIEDPDISRSTAWWGPRKFHYACVEQAYKAFLAAGLAPQKARGVLPQDTATRLIMNGTLADWKHFFRLRLGGGADPMIRSLSRMALDEFIKAGYGETFEEFV